MDGKYVIDVPLEHCCMLPVPAFAKGAGTVWECYCGVLWTVRKSVEGGKYWDQMRKKERRRLRG